MFWQKESFWGAVVSVLVPVLNHFLGWGFEVEYLAAIIIPMIALIIGSEWKEAQIARAELMLDVAMIEAGIYEEE